MTTRTALTADQQIRLYFRTLYPEGTESDLSIWTLEDKRTIWLSVSRLEEAATRASQLARTMSVYVGVGIRDREEALRIAQFAENEDGQQEGRKPETIALEQVRGTGASVVGLPALYTEIDIAGPEHAQVKLPQTLEAVLAFIRKLPLQPTMIVFSGGGVHLYWCLREVWRLPNAEERQAAQDLLKRWEATVHDYAARAGWKLDSVSDLARVLRPAGTWNRKRKPVEVRLIESDGPRYNLSDFEPYLPDPLPKPQPGSAPTSGGRPSADRLVAQALALVAEGRGRNNACFHLACQARDNGYSRQEMETTARSFREYAGDYNARGMLEPFTEQEALNCVEQALKRPAREPSALPGPVLIRLADVVREEVHWRWKDRLPLGRLTGLIGDPEVGKSWLSLAIATAVTTGAPLPGDTERWQPARVLLLTAEDGLADTVRPRLEDMSADLRNVTVLRAIREGNGQERHPDLVRDLPALESALAEGGYHLVIIDPLNAYLGTVLDTHRDAALRSVLGPLAGLAERYDVAIVFILHLTKGQRDRAIYRGQGNIAYVAAARVVHLIGVNPEEEEERVIACIKNNLAPKRPPIAFELKEGRFLWRGETSVTPAALLAPERREEERPAQEEAVDFLCAALADGPRPAQEVTKEAGQVGIKEATLRRARRLLGVKPRKHGFGKDGTWVWTLSKDDQNPKGDQDDHLNDLDHLRSAGGEEEVLRWKV